MKDEDIMFEQRRQARIDAESSTDWPQWHQKVGTVIPFSRTADRDPNPRIPLSVPQDSPMVIEAIAWSIIAAGVGLIYWWVA